jgi:hypothetical protein
VNFPDLKARGVSGPGWDRGLMVLGWFDGWPCFWPYSDGKLIKQRYEVAHPSGEVGYQDYKEFKPGLSRWEINE